MGLVPQILRSVQQVILFWLGSDELLWRNSRDIPTLISSSVVQDLLSFTIKVPH